MEHRTNNSTKPVVYLTTPTSLLHEYIAAEAQKQQFTLRSYASFDSFLSVYDGTTPGCIVLSSARYDRESADQLRRIRVLNKNAQVILSVGGWRVLDIVKAIQEGFADFLDITIDADRLSNMLSSSIERDRILTEEGRVEIPQSLLHALNSEEAEIFRLLLLGKTTKQISAELDLSIRTVHYRKTSIFEKIGVRDRNEAFQIVRAIRHDNESRIPRPHISKTCRNDTVQDVECVSDTRS